MTKITLIVLCFFTITSYAQEKTIIDQKITDKLVSVTFTKTNDNGVVEKDTNYFYRDISTEQDLQLAMKNNYIFEKNFYIKKEKGKEIVMPYNKQFNEAMLNVLFSEEVSSYLADSKDLSLKKSHAIISTADKTLFIGGSFVMGRKNKTEKLTHILTTGIKTKLNEKFASFLNYKTGNLDNEIGINLKYTWIGRGIINFNGHSKELKNLNEKVIIPKYSDKVATAIKNKTYVNELKEYENIYGLSSSTYIKKQKAYFAKKYEELYLSLAEEEVSKMKSEKLYNYLWDHYVTLELFAPISRKIYNLAPVISADLTTKKFEDEKFYPWKFNVGYTNFWKTVKGSTFYLSGFASVFNNNNIETSDLKSKTFQTFNSTNINVLESTDSFFLGDYKRFTTTNLKAEFVSYFIKKGAAGVSAAIEKNIGEEYDALNWKLGIPVSLKDKEGKPTINFEIQWREVNSDHFLGIGVGFAFGKFIK